MRPTMRTAVMIGVVVSAILLFRAGGALAQDAAYPNKPINFIIPFSAGGPSDIAARTLMDSVSKTLGQPVISINKAGGGGTVGAMTVMSAKPDGYTVGLFSGSLALLSPHMEDCPFKDLNGFTFVSNFGKYIWPVIARGDGPYKNWKEFVAWAKQNPRAVKCAIPAARSHVAAGIALWEVEQKEGIENTYLVYPGSAEALTAILGGHINLYGMSLFPTILPHIKEGRLRILTYLANVKMSGYENIPSLEEIYGIKTSNFMGVWGPKGIPAPVLDKLDAALAKGVKEPAFVDVMQRMYTPVVYMNHATVDREVREMFPKTAEKVKTIRAADKAKGKN